MIQQLLEGLNLMVDCHVFLLFYHFICVNDSSSCIRWHVKIFYCLLYFKIFLYVCVFVVSFLNHWLLLTLFYQCSSLKLIQTSANLKLNFNSLFLMYVAIKWLFPSWYLQSSYLSSYIRKNKLFWFEIDCFLITSQGRFLSSLNTQSPALNVVSRRWWNLYLCPSVKFHKKGSTRSLMLLAFVSTLGYLIMFVYSI